MRIIRQRDIDALRSGIREQERCEWEREAYQRDFDQRQARVHPQVDHLCLVRGHELRTGDILVNCEGGNSFYRDETINYVVRAGSHAVWVQWGDLDIPHAGNSGLVANLVAGVGGGRQIRRDAVVLVERTPSVVSPSNPRER